MKTKITFKGYKNMFFNQFSVSWINGPLESIGWFLDMLDIEEAKRLLNKINRDRERFGQKPFFPNYGHRLF